MKNKMSCAILGALLAAGVAAEPANPVVPPARQAVLDLMQQLGADSHSAREQASAGLAAIGPSAVPLMAEWSNHPDPEIAYRVRAVLRRLQGTPGKPAQGLTLAAALVGTRPTRGQAVAFWLSIRNVSDHDIYLFRYMWDLKLRTANPRSVTRTVCAHSPATFEARDFYRLKPGETQGFMMDADPDPDVQTADMGEVRLEVSLPDQAREAAPGPLFTGSEELISGPVEMAFADPPPAEAEPRVMALATAVGRGEADAEKALAAAPEMARAVRWGLRQANAGHRWRVFEFACGHPRPEYEDDLVEFLARHGPRIRSEEQQMKLLAAYAATLPAARKWPFYNRVALAIAYDWRSLDDFVLGFSSSENVAERAEAARLALRLHESGVRLADGLSFLAWELYTTPDAQLRNRDKAAELAKAGLELAPNNQTLRLAQAAFAEDKAALRRICEEAPTGQAQNNLAYALTTRFPVGSLDPAWACDLADKAIRQTPESNTSFPYYADTLAGSRAYQGDYRAASTWQEKSLAHVAADDGERPGIAARAAYYTALSAGEPEDRPRMATAFPPLKSLKARDAVLARLATETDRDVRATLLKLLATCYPADAKAREALNAAK